MLKKFSNVSMDLTGKINDLKCHLLLIHNLSKILKLVRRSENPECELTSLTLRVPKDLIKVIGERITGFNSQEIAYILSISISKLSKSRVDNSLEELREALVERSYLETIMRSSKLLNEAISEDIIKAFNLIPESQRIRRSVITHDDETMTHKV